MSQERKLGKGGFVVVLLLAVVVGFVGQFLFAKNGNLEFLGDRGEKKVEVVETVDVRSLDEVLDEMQELNSNLGRYYEKSKVEDAESVVTQVTKYIHTIRSNYEELGQHELLPEHEATAQRVMMRSHYLAAKIIPNYDDDFQSFVDQMIEIRPDSHDAAEAKILRFCAKQALQQPQSQALFDTVESMADAFDKKWYGIMLYAVVARELWSHGQDQSSKRVLEQGIQKFKGEEGQSTLVHQLVDQGFRPAPKPAVAMAKHETIRKIMSKKTGGTSGGCRKFR